MKKSSALLFAALISLSVNAQTKYGKSFDSKKAIDVPAFTTKMKRTDKIDEVVVKGKITQVCQAAGCWVKLKNGNGEDVFVKFREDKGHHELTVPKDITGRTAIVFGKASRKTVSVEECKHMAEDAGKSADEIAKITAPKQEIRIDATGVIVE